ncbi:MAG: hypothetical protein ACO1OB_14610 [Archangium sp.]
MSRLLLPLLLLTASGCATAKLVGPRAEVTADPGTQRTVVIEPLFELAELKTSFRTEYATVTNPYSGLGYGGYGYGGGFGPGMGPSTVAITREVREKPFFARPPVLNAIHDRVLAEVQKRRPSWRVTSTSGAPLLTGNVTVVRTVIEASEMMSSDRALKNLAFGFGLVILPLQFINIDPVHETQRVFGIVERFQIEGGELNRRLVKYPSQPDFAVNLAGYQQLRREFGLDVSYDEGLLADERPRGGVLVEGFVDRLAAAVIALVEEQP